MKKEFIAIFQLSKTKLFQVRYRTLCGNAHPYFSTTAAEFCCNKKDYVTCGQAQEYVCGNYPTAYRFYKKWDKLHLQDLTDEQYAELRADMEKLADKYNCIVKEFDNECSFRPEFSIWELAEWSKQKPKGGTV